VVTALASLVATSQRVGAAPARLAKVRELKALLETLEPDEIETAVHYLSGEIARGRIGIRPRCAVARNSCLHAN
jgi:hypothetical protein